MRAPDAQGAYGGVGPVTSRICSALWVRDRMLRSESDGVHPVLARFADLSAHVTGVHRMRPVVCRLPLEFDA